jgi:hypothetical protein
MRSRKGLTIGVIMLIMFIIGINLLLVLFFIVIPAQKEKDLREQTTSEPNSSAVSKNHEELVKYTELELPWDFNEMVNISYGDGYLMVHYMDGDGQYKSCGYGSLFYKNIKHIKWIMPKVERSSK